MNQAVSNVDNSSNVVALMSNLNLGKHPPASDTSSPPKRPRRNFGLTDFKGPLQEKVQVAAPVHPHSAEEQELFVDITEAATSDDIRERMRGIKILTHDASLQPLLLRLAHFIFDSVRVNIIQEFPFLLSSLMDMVDAMLQNANLDIEPGLFKLLPAVVSVLVAKPMKGHFRQKRHCAKLLERIVKSEPVMKQRITNVLISGLYRHDCNIYATYGLVYALNCLGDTVIDNYLFPNLHRVKSNLNGAASDEAEDASFVFTAVRRIIRNYVQTHQKKDVEKFRKEFELFVLVD
uniref:TAF6_C domain-containing protein n=1 Tax=Panagrellus redivivus TaxID=6233 RepID=A0A7E4ZRU7_PANRE